MQDRIEINMMWESPQSNLRNCIIVSIGYLTIYRLHELFHDIFMDLDDEVYIYVLDSKAPMKEYSLYEV